MKKLFVLMIVLLVSGAIVAQGNKEKATPKSFLAIHAGPSFPVGEFQSKSFNTETGFFGGGGFAKTGINLNLNYGYSFVDNFGLAVSAFYNNNKLNNKAFVDELNTILNSESTGEVIDVTGVKLDHWQWYGLTVGPALMHNLTPNLAIDVRVMGGIANVNSPKVTYEGVTVFGEDWAVAPVFQGGADMRIGVGNNMFVFVNADYVYMKPKFKKELTDPFTNEVLVETGKQKMSVINVSGGFGIRF